MSNFIAVFDACVLHPASLRDLLIRLAMTELFRARWTEEIHVEWQRSVQRRFPDVTARQLQRTRELMDGAVPECLVTDYGGLADHIDLPDGSDRHILAAAIKCGAGAIVTYNLKDFPADRLPPGLTAQHPDEFVSHLFDLNRGLVCRAVKDQRESLTNPPFTVDQMLDRYLANGLASTVECLGQMRELL